MQQALVIGTATSVVKHESLTGQKMLLAVAVSRDGRRVESDPMIVFDKLGAGVGDLVLISSDGSFTGNEIIGTRKTPARWAVIGIIDRRKKEEQA
ncbi:MAG: EutN/CcmL family microcompartment protein [Thermoguttaceae bacterium]|nr:EutN/CcmL family microcompartment protein [Thermoguttaceae bacterium]